MHGEHQTSGTPGPQNDDGLEPLGLPAADEAAPAAEAEEPARARSIAPLRMVFGTALQYPREIAFALLALVITSAATLAIPWRFKVIIDEAFGGTANSNRIATNGPPA